jgi:hypothetical protein
MVRIEPEIGLSRIEPAADDYNVKEVAKKEKI